MQWTKARGSKKRPLGHSQAPGVLPAAQKDGGHEHRVCKGGGGRGAGRKPLCAHSRQAERGWGAQAGAAPSPHSHTGGQSSPLRMLWGIQSCPEQCISPQGEAGEGRGEADIGGERGSLQRCAPGPQPGEMEVDRQLPLAWTLRPEDRLWEGWTSRSGHESCPRALHPRDANKGLQGASDPPWAESRGCGLSGGWGGGIWQAWPKAGARPPVPECWVWQ